jgi:hypothetical protein
MEVIDGAHRGGKLLGERRGLVAIEPGTNHPAQPLGKPRDTLEEHLDLIRTVARHCAFQVGLHGPGQSGPEPREDPRPPCRVPRVIVKLVSRDAPQPGAEIVAPLEGAQIAVGCDEDFLRQIVDVVQMVHLAGDEAAER